MRLGRDSRDLLLGRAADAADQQLIRDRIEEKPGVDELLELLTMYMGPDRLIVAARVAFSDRIGAGAVEDLAEQIDRELSGQLSATPHVFIDPTDTASGSRGAAARPASAGECRVGRARRLVLKGALPGRVGLRACPGVSGACRWLVQSAGGLMRSRAAGGGCGRVAAGQGGGRAGGGSSRVA